VTLITFSVVFALLVLDYLVQRGWDGDKRERNSAVSVHISPDEIIQRVYGFEFYVVALTFEF